MPCLITALTRSANNNTKRKKNKISKTKKITAKTQYLNLRASSKQRPKLSDKTLIAFFLTLTIQQRGFFFN